MIEVKGVSKRFGDICAVQPLTMQIREEEVFGLIGTNGAGKSTLLRLMAGVLKADEGEILIDGVPVYENPAAKQQICFLPDTGYFPVSATSASRPMHL